MDEKTTDPAQRPAPAQTTEQRLASVNDAGLFESIGNAVIRIKYPEYGELIELGINVDGKTCKAPVDGITMTHASITAQLVMVQHTVAAAKDLRGKWMHDPKAVRPRTGREPTQPKGDVLKAQEIAATERQRTPTIRAILFLTTNKEPDQRLVRDVVAFGAARGLEVHILSRSAIAHVLDHIPAGQSVRRQLLGIPQEALSWDLLRKLGQQSVRELALPDDPAARIPTRAQCLLKGRNGPLTLLVGTSGSGKSVAAHEWLRNSLSDENVACLVLRERTLEGARGIDQAITTELQALYPQLQPSVSALSICGPNQRLQLVLEDITNSENPSQLLELLVGWASSKRVSSENQIPGAPWHLVCPVQPHMLDLLPIERVRGIEAFRVEIPPLTKTEASAAVRRRMGLLGQVVTPFEASAVADALGDDPLLIGLYEPKEITDPSLVIGNYVERKLSEFAAGRPSVRHKAERALFALGDAMLRYRTLVPDIDDILEWLAHDGLEDIACHLIDFGGPISVHRTRLSCRLRFRHDRVRDWLLTECLRRQFDEGTLNSTTIEEPYYAEWLGAACACSSDPVANAERLIQANPLAAFSAFARAVPVEHRNAIHALLKGWLEDDQHRGRRYYSLRWMAQRTLAQIEADGVVSLLQKFPERTRFADVARLRNRDLSGALQLCITSDIATRHWQRDALIAHIAQKWPSGFIKAMTQIILDPQITGRVKSAAFCVAGISAQTELANAIAERWRSEGDEEKVLHLADYVWAAARCYALPHASEALDAALDLWANLARKSASDNSGAKLFLLDDLRLSFAHHPPVDAIPHLLRRASEPALRAVLAWTLGGLDDPDVVLFKIAFEAEIRKRSAFVPDGIYFHWQRQRDYGRELSGSTREALNRLWRDPEAKLAERQIGLRLWGLGATELEISSLALLESDNDLKDSALAVRMERGDRRCVPLLIDRLQHSERQFSWWYQSYQVLCPQILEQIPKMLRANAGDLQEQERGHGWAKVAADLLTRDASPLSERILIETWSLAGRHGFYVQAAIFLGGAHLEDLAERTVQEAADPRNLFQFADMFFSGQTNGHPGATREEQFKRLLPYRAYLDDMTRASFRQRCEDLGFATIGRAFNEDDGRYAWTTDTLEEWFEIVAREQPHSFSVTKLEGWLTNGLDRAVLFDRLTSWLWQTDSPAAPEAAAAILRSVGREEDVEVLASAIFEDPTSRDALISDTRFAIRRRSLQPAR